MGDNHNKESSGIVCVVSRQVGTVAGTSMVISKKIAGCGVKTVTGAKDWLQCLVPARGKDSSPTSQESAIKSRNEQETGRKKAAKALIASLESDLAAAQRDLKKARSNAEKTHSKLASQLVALKEEKEILISDQIAEEKVEVVSTEEEVQSDIEPLSQKAVEVEIPAPAAVTDEEVQASVFANATDKIIFARALSDIASGDATVRVDAAKIMAGVRHELSIKTLAAQMACESSAQVRQECIKALAAMKMTEALPAVEHALTDEAGSVRLAAVWGLYHLAEAESAPVLIRMFADNDEEVRRRAATCIGWLDKKELAVELLPLLDDNSISVRRAAVEAMSNLRNRQVVSSLIERLNDPVESIRKVVLSAIETITGKKMCKSFPKDQKEFERLIVRWRQWCKEQLLG